MKIAIGGKGGVGKTTLTAMMAKFLSQKGRRVLAVDADPNTNLALALGFPEDAKIIPLVEMKDLIEERTGARPGGKALLFKLNPKVDDIPDKYSLEQGNIRLMVMGGMREGGSGCYCPENQFLRALVAHLVLGRDEIVILDMEAGIEHLSRGTAQTVDRLIIVTEPSRRSLETARRIGNLATDIGIKAVSLVGNKIAGEKEREFLRKEASGLDFLAFLPYDEKIRKADRTGCLSETSSEMEEEVRRIVREIER